MLVDNATVLVTVIGILVTILLTVVMPRWLGQVVPVSQVDAAKQAGLLETAKAQAEAATWKSAFEGMKDAHNGLLTINQQLSQSAVIANAMMNQLKQLPSAGSG
jgi:hypothetical protein